MLDAFGIRHLSRSHFQLRRASEGTSHRDNLKHFFLYKNMLSRSEPREEIEIAANKIATMFLNFGNTEPERSYKHGSYKKKKCVMFWLTTKNVFPLFSKIHPLNDSYIAFSVLVLFYSNRSLIILQTRPIAINLD